MTFSAVVFGLIFRIRNACSLKSSVKRNTKRTGLLELRLKLGRL